MLQNARVTAFTVSELLRENQHGERVKNRDVHLKIRSFCVIQYLSQSDLQLTKPRLLSGRSLFNELLRERVSVKELTWQHLYSAAMQCWQWQEIRVTSCFLYTSYKFIFAYKLQVIDYYTSFKLLFIYNLQVVIDFTIYELLFNYELRVTVYCASYCLLLFINFCKTYKLYLKSSL